MHDLKHDGHEDGGCYVNLCMYIYEVARYIHIGESACVSHNTGGMEREAGEEAGESGIIRRETELHACI